MQLRRLPAVALSLAAATLATSVLLHAQAQQRFVYASALDKQGAPVADLGPADFVVREDKVAREILSVAPAADPMQIALLVDSSQAADPYVRDLRAGLTAFISTIGADPSGARHQVSIITIGERPTVNTDYTPNLATATKGAQRIFAMPGSGTYLLDGVIEASQAIKKREFTRPVIVAVITSGIELSNRPYQAALEPLFDAGAVFNVAVVGRPITGPQDRAIMLDRGTRETGGRYETVLASSGLTPRLTQLARDLTHQYKVTYARPQTLIPPEKVTVESAKPDLDIRGYAPRQTETR